MNNLFKQLHPQSQIRANQRGSLPSKNNDLLKSFLNSSNPQELLNSLISSNPQMKNLMNVFQSSGMTPKQFFYNYAQQQGINPDEFLNSLKSGKE